MMAEWLDAHAPDRKARVLNRVREMRGGGLNDAGWGTRMRGQGVYAESVAKRFRLAARRLGLDRPTPALDCTRFRPPPRPGDQLALL